MIIAGFADVRATIRIFRIGGISKIFEEVEFLGEVEDAGALPVSRRKSSVLLTGLDNQNFTICPYQFGIYFLLTNWTDALGFLHTSPPITGERASTINASGSRIMDIVTIRSYLRTFAGVEADVMMRIDE
jgi:hypothetical protein